MTPRIRTLGLVLGGLILSNAYTSSSYGQAVTTAFTYQGVVKNAGVPLNGTVDLRFSLWTAAVGGSQVGSSLSVNAASLTDGLLTTTLDFGTSAFGGSQRFLQIEVDTTPAGGAGPFVTLTPRQPLTAVPYATYALSGAGQWTPSGSNLNYTNGNVSVGTTTSSAKMTIYPNSGGGGVQTGLLVRNLNSSDQYTVASFVADSPAAIGLSVSVPTAGGATGRAISATNASTTGWAGYFVGRGHFSDQVGIGTTNPLALLQISRASGDSTDPLRITTTTGSPLVITSVLTVSSGSLNATSTFGDSAVSLNNTSAGNVFLATGGGNVGVGATTASTSKMHVFNGSDAEPTGGGFLVLGSDTSTNIRMDNNEIMAVNNGAPATLFLNNDGGDVTISPAGTGRLITRVLQITGGADLSEQFEVCDAQIEPQPGMVVVIDPANPGRLMPATSAYDKKVAGIISGAGGVATGMTMGHTGTIADGSHAVALTGRVYCFVDATETAIEPGDLLTTSDTLGHAMKAVDAERSHGTVIGKAMTALPRGEKGLVLVLVNLQ